MSFLETYGQDLAETLYRQGYNKIQITQTLAEHARLFASSQTAWSSVINSPARRVYSALVVFSSEPEAFLRIFYNALFGAPRLAAVGTTRITSEIFNRVPLPERLKFLRNRVEPNGSEIWTQVMLAMFVGTASIAQGIQAFSAAVSDDPTIPALLPADRLLPLRYDPFSPIKISYNSNWLAPDIPVTTSNGPATLDLVAPWDAGFRQLRPWQFATGRFSQPLRIIHDQVIGENFFGEPFDTALDRFNHIAQSALLPIGAEELLGVFTGSPDEPRLGTGATLFQAGTGINLRSPSTSAGRDWRAQLYAQANGIEGIESYDDLNLVQKRQLNYEPAYLAERVRVLQEEVDRYGTDSGQARLLNRFTIDGRYVYSRYEGVSELIIGLFDSTADPDVIRARYSARENSATGDRINTLNHLYGNYGEAETSEIDGSTPNNGYFNDVLQMYFSIIDQSTIGAYKDGFDTNTFNDLIEAFYEEDPGRELVIEAHRNAFPLPDFVRKIDDAYDELSQSSNTGNSLLDRARATAGARTNLLRVRVLDIIRQDNILPSDLIDQLLTGTLPENTVELIQNKLKEYFEPTLIGLAEAELAQNQN